MRGHAQSTRAATRAAIEVQPRTMPERPQRKPCKRNVRFPCTGTKCCMQIQRGVRLAEKPEIKLARAKEVGYSHNKICHFATSSGYKPFFLLQCVPAIAGTSTQCRQSWHVSAITRPYVRPRVIFMEGYNSRRVCVNVRRANSLHAVPAVRICRYVDELLTRSPACVGSIYVPLATGN